MRSLWAQCLAFLGAFLVLHSVAIAQPQPDTQPTHHDPQQHTESHRECPAETITWAQTCAQTQSIKLIVRDCPDRRAVFALGLPDQSLVQIEVAQQPNGFRTVRDLSISPVAEFTDWNQAPAPLRDGFDKFIQCVERDATLRTGSPDTVSQPRWSPNSQGPGVVSATREGLRGPLHATPILSWRLSIALAALIAMAALWFRRAQRDTVKSTLLRTVAPLVVLTIATFVTRLALRSPTYFHQNGQGPLWVDYSLGLPSSYGAGMREVFGWFTVRAADPDATLVLVQSLLAALTPACAWLLARRAGASSWTAWGLAAVVALEPAFTRMSRSESYFATCTSLSLIASAVLVTGASQRNWKAPAFWLGAVSAGFILSQAARIHPVAWIPITLVPLVLFAGPGRLARRTRITLAALATVGVVVAATALPSMLETLRGELGQKWTGPGQQSPARIPWQHTLKLVLATAPIAALLIVLSQRRLHAALRASLALIVVIAGALTNRLGNLPPWYGLAYAWLHAPVVFACIAALVAHASRSAMHQRIAAAVLTVGLVTVNLMRWRTLNESTTDQLEQQFVYEIRSRIPSDAAITYLSSAQQRRVFLPLYPRARNARLFAMGMNAHEIEMGMFVPWPQLYYFRSSLCSTPEGHAACEAFERTHRIEPVDTRALPARPSMPDLTYDTPSVNVGLYRLLQ